MIYRAALALSVSIAALAASGTSFAQTAVAEPAASASPIKADQEDIPGEIIVTAQKRSERLSEVPLSITAASGEQLAKRGVTSTADLEKIVTGFTYQPTNYGVPVFTIRGIGFYDFSLAVAPAVSVYVDQVPLPFAAMTSGATLDLERVEALKGPQGTLFGQNSTGGAINYIAAKPTDRFEAGARLTYGRFNQVDGEGYLSGPLADTLKGRIAIRAERRDDWQKSYTRNDTIGQRNFLTGRALLDWQPTNAIKFELNANGWRDRSDNPAAQLIAYRPTVTPGYPDAAAALANYPLAPHNSRAADWDPGRSYRRNDYFYQFSLRGDLNISDNVTLSSISAYSRYKTDSPTDVDGVNIENFQLRIRGNVTSFSQEMRLAGTLGDRLKWMVGGNYGHDRTLDEQQFYDTIASNAGIGPLRWTGGINSSRQRISSAAAFGSVDYKLTDTLTLQGSARYTDARRSFQGCSRDTGDGTIARAFALLSTLLSGTPTTIAPGACFTLLNDPASPNNNKPAGLISRSLKENNVSWRVSLDWKPLPSTLLYANLTKGYKAGSFSTLAAVYDTSYTPAPQESVLAYEAGFKTNLFDRHLQLSGAAFYYDYRDKQTVGFLFVGPPIGTTPGLVSIPRSSVRGAELEATLRPFDGFTFTGGVTYVDSRVDDHFMTPDPFSGPVDIKGEALPNTPKWQISGDAEYEFPVSEYWKAFVGASGRYRTKTAAAIGKPGLAINAGLFDLKPYGILDLRVGAETNDGKFRLEAWGRNVTNTYYWNNVSHVVDTVARTTGMPATYGVTLGYSFK